MIFKELNIEQVQKIREIDGECYVHKDWREINGIRTLVVIDWTDYELPNGLSWHMDSVRVIEVNS